MSRNILRRAWHFLARVNVAAVLIAIVLLLAALGSCFPQLSSSVAADPERLAAWEANLRARYGALTDFLASAGLFRWFRSPAFLLLLALLAAASLVCTLNRWRGLWRRTFHTPVRCSDVVFNTAPHTAVLVAPSATALPDIVRERLHARGFHVRSEAGEDAVYLRGDRYRLAPLATLVTHLGVLLLLLGTVLSSGLGWKEELTIEPGETAVVGNGSQLALRNEGFAIERYPDGSAAAYEADIAIIDGGQEVMRGPVRVNEPMTYSGVGVVLLGYGGTEGRYSVTLLTLRDPGYGLVVVAGLLLLLGLTVSLYFSHRCIHARIDPEGMLRLAGRADRRAWDFGREFAALTEELQRDGLAQVKHLEGVAC